MFMSCFWHARVKDTTRSGTAKLSVQQKKNRMDSHANMPGMPQKNMHAGWKSAPYFGWKNRKVTCFPLLCLKLHRSKNHLANIEICLNSMIGAWKIFMHSDSSNRKPNARTNNHKYANHGHRKLKNYRLDSERPHIWSGGVSLTHTICKIPWMLVWHNGKTHKREQIATIQTHKINFGILMPLLTVAVVTSLQFICSRASLSFWLSEFYPNIYCYHKAMTNLAEHWNIHGSILAVRLPVPPGVAVAWTGAPFAAARLPPVPGQRIPPETSGLSCMSASTNLSFMTSCSLRGQIFTYAYHAISIYIFLCVYM